GGGERRGGKEGGEGGGGRGRSDRETGENRDRTQSAYRRRSEHPPRQSGPLQARQGTARPGGTAVTRSATFFASTAREVSASNFCEQRKPASIRNHRTCRRI